MESGIFIDHNYMIEKAKIFASVAHDGQTRRNGEPYISHPTRIAVEAESKGMSKHAIATAYLHDVVEDTLVLPSTIRREFGNKVADMVEELTITISDIEDKDAKLKENIRKMSVECYMLKCLDRIDNLDNATESYCRRTLKIFHERAELDGIGSRVMAKAHLRLYDIKKDFPV